MGQSPLLCKYERQPFTGSFRKTTFTVFIEFILEQDGRSEVKKLQSTLLSINGQHKEEIEKCQEGIAHRKDLIQESKNLHTRELKYVKKSCQLETAMHMKATKAEVSIAFRLKVTLYNGG